MSEEKGTLATYNLIDALRRNPLLIQAGADISRVAADRIEELEAQLAKVTAELETRKADNKKWRHEATERSNQLIAAIPRAYRMGLEDAANVLLDKHTNNVGMVHPITGADCRDIRATPTPTDLVERVMKETGQ